MAYSQPSVSPGSISLNSTNSYRLVTIYIALTLYWILLSKPRDDFKYMGGCA